VGGGDRKRIAAVSFYVSDSTLLTITGRKNGSGSLVKQSLADPGKLAAKTAVNQRCRPREEKSNATAPKVAKIAAVTNPAVEISARE